MAFPSLINLLRLHEIFEFRRSAANWVRLVLALLGPSRPWSIPGESWRFVRPYSGYPFSWICSRKVDHQLEFDQTLNSLWRRPSSLLCLFSYLPPCLDFLFWISSLSAAVINGIVLLFFLSFVFFVSCKGASSGLKSVPKFACPLRLFLFAALPCNVGAMDDAGMSLNPIEILVTSYDQGTEEA